MPYREKLATCIQRINLDALWDRELATVANNLRHAKKILQCSKEVELDRPFKSDSPMPEYDYCGYEVAIEMIMYSTKPERYSQDYIQFKTICQL